MTEEESKSAYDVIVDGCIECQEYVGELSSRIEGAFIYSSFINGFLARREGGKDVDGVEDLLDISMELLSMAKKATELYLEMGDKIDGFKEEDMEGMADYMEAVSHQYMEMSKRFNEMVSPDPVLWGAGRLMRAGSEDETIEEFMSRNSVPEGWFTCDISDGARTDDLAEMPLRQTLLIVGLKARGVDAKPVGRSEVATSRLVTKEEAWEVIRETYETWRKL